MFEDKKQANTTEKQPKKRSKTKQFLILFQNKPKVASQTDFFAPKIIKTMSTRQRHFSTALTKIDGKMCRF